jgi:hypothetical protein
MELEVNTLVDSTRDFMRHQLRTLPHLKRHV